jgi:hypothetical protein
MCEAVRKYAEEYAKEYAEEYAKEKYNQGALETAIKYHLNYNIPLKQLCSDCGLSESEALIAIKQYKLCHNLE